MSTYYDLVCVEHGESLGVHWNHGATQLAEFAQTLPAWAAMDPIHVTAAATRIDWIAEWGPCLEEVIAYAKRHVGCTVKPKDEYGRWFDRCQESIRCGECGKYDNCVLDVNHDEPCRRS